MPSNYSLYAIPAYHVISLLPHMYAVSMMKKANNGKWDNSNPRSANWDAGLRKSALPGVYARYERSESAHKNGMENMPLFYAACILGNMARLPSGTLNAFVGLYLTLRIAYTLAYINIERSRASFARTGIYLCGVIACWWTMIKSANVFLQDM